MNRGNTAIFTVLDYSVYEQRCDLISRLHSTTSSGDVDFVRPLEYFEDYDDFSLIVPFSSGVPDWSMSPNPAD